MRKPATPDSSGRHNVQAIVRKAGVRNAKCPDRTENKSVELSSVALGDEQSLNDAWLVEHARHGDHQAFAVLVRRYERKLISVLTRLVHHPEQARDLAQETFWRVYTRLDRFDTARRFGPWLFRVAVNLGLDWLRSSKSEASAVTSIDRAGRDGHATFVLPDPDPRIQAELTQEVQFILGLLPVSHRTVLVLRDLEGFSSSEIAAIVGRRESTVRWQLCTAREKFREIWERRQDGRRSDAKDGSASDGKVDG
jgi:RNA polymerase sigma-70 factor (ECF subfamily)